jgi:hypothetical protein
MKLQGLHRKTDSGIFYDQPPMSMGIRPKPISLGTKNEEEVVEVYYDLLADTNIAFYKRTHRMEGARFVGERHRSSKSQETERVPATVVDLLNNREAGHPFHRDPDRPSGS